MKDLNELRKTAEEATPGPWVYGDNRDGLGNKLHPAKFPGKYNPIADFEYTEDEDAEHIATFDPPTVLALIARLEQAEENLESALEANKRWAHRSSRERSEIFKAEAAVARVREVSNMDEHGDVSSSEETAGFHVALRLVRRALDGESNE